MSDSSNRSGGIGFFGLLTIVFIVMKILGKITWSWWWVLSPIWIVTGIWIAIAAVALFFCLVATLWDRYRVAK